MTETNTNHPFIERLWSFAENDQRGVLADLRRGLGQPPGTVPKMYPYVIPYLPAECSIWQEETYYLIAALFAYYQSGSGGDSRRKIEQGNLGDHLRTAVFKDNMDEAPVERRFSALLAADRQDLSYYLKDMISLLKSHDVAVHWNQLFRDLQYWQTESKSVQKRWANSFWRKTKNTDQTN